MNASPSSNERAPIWDMEQAVDVDEQVRRPQVKCSMTSYTQGARTVVLNSDGGFGFNIVGYADSKSELGPSGVFISKITPHSVAAESGAIFPGDQLISVNGHDMEHVSHSEAVSILQKAGDVLELRLVCNQRGFAEYQALVPELCSVKPKDPSEMAALMAPSDDDEDSESLDSSALSEDDPTVAIRESDSHYVAPHKAMIHMSTVSVMPDHEELHVRLGQEQLSKGDYERAEQHFLRALHTNISDELMQEIVAASRNPDVKQAKQDCDQLIQAAQEDKAGVNYLLGWALARQNRISEAQLPFTLCVQQCMPWFYYAGLRVEPDDAQFHFRVGNALASQNKLLEARTALANALELRPNRMQWRAALETVCQRIELELSSSSDSLATYL
eukprot:m.7634 g.7634  ORF g.7634 m.7634 type:complete len:387 (-) comp2777_c0_seq1:246-1406(-)